MPSYTNENLKVLANVSRRLFVLVYVGESSMSIHSSTLRLCQGRGRDVPWMFTRQRLCVFFTLFLYCTDPPQWSPKYWVNISAFEKYSRSLQVLCVESFCSVADILSSSLCFPMPWSSSLYPIWLSGCGLPWALERLAFKHECTSFLQCLPIRTKT